MPLRRKTLELAGLDAAAAAYGAGIAACTSADAGGRAGLCKIGYVSLDDSNPKSGRWDPGITASDAKTAAQDTSTIAYLGDFNSAFHPASSLFEGGSA